MNFAKSASRSMSDRVQHDGVAEVSVVSCRWSGALVLDLLGVEVELEADHGELNGA